MLQENPCTHPRRTGRAGPLLCEAKYTLNKMEFSLVTKGKKTLPSPPLEYFLEKTWDCKSFPCPFESM